MLQNAINNNFGFNNKNNLFTNQLPTTTNALTTTESIETTTILPLTKPFVSFTQPPTTAAPEKPTTRPSTANQHPFANNPFLANIPIPSNFLQAPPAFSQPSIPNPLSASPTFAQNPFLPKLDSNPFLPPIFSHRTGSDGSPQSASSVLNQVPATTQFTAAPTTTSVWPSSSQPTLAPSFFNFLTNKPNQFTFTNSLPTFNNVPQQFTRPTPTAQSPRPFNFNFLNANQQQSQQSNGFNSFSQRTPISSGFNSFAPAQTNSNSNHYTGSFNAPPGVLTPFDNQKRS